jgi:hypothetical protein
MNPTAVRTGLSTALDTITNLRCFDYVPDSLSPPAAIVEPLEIEYGTAMANGLNRVTAYVLIVVGRMSDRSSQDRIDAYVNTTGASSVVAAIEADPTLGGTAESLVVTDFRPLNAEDVASLQYWGGAFDVTVYAR